MDQNEFNMIVRQTQSFIYCNELDRAVQSLLKLIQMQSKSIEELKQSIKDNQ